MAFLRLLNLFWGIYSLIFIDSTWVSLTFNCKAHRGAELADNSRKMEKQWKPRKQDVENNKSEEEWVAVHSGRWEEEADIVKHPGIRAHLQEGEIRFADRQ